MIALTDTEIIAIVCRYHHERTGKWLDPDQVSVTREGGRVMVTTKEITISDRGSNAFHAFAGHLSLMPSLVVSSNTPLLKLDPGVYSGTS